MVELIVLAAMFAIFLMAGYAVLALSNSSDGTGLRSLEGESSLPPGWIEFADGHDLRTHRALSGTYRGRHIRARPEGRPERESLDSSHMNAAASVLLFDLPSRKDPRSTDRWLSSTFVISGSTPVSTATVVRPRHYDVSAMPTPDELQSNSTEFLLVEGDEEVVREAIRDNAEIARLFLQVFVRNGEWIELRDDEVSLRCEALKDSSLEVERWLDLGVDLVDAFEAPEDTNTGHSNSVAEVPQDDTETYW